MTQQFNNLVNKFNLQKKIENKLFMEIISKGLIYKMDKAICNKKIKSMYIFQVMKIFI